GAKLQVNTLGSSFRSNHDRTMVPKIIHQSFTTIRSRDTCDDIAIFIFSHPVLVDCVGSRGVILPAEQYKSLTASGLPQGLSEVFLGLRRISKNNRFLRSTNLPKSSETLIQCIT